MKVSSLAIMVTLALSIQVNANEHRPMSCSIYQGQLIQAQRTVDRLEAEVRHERQRYDRSDSVYTLRVRDLDRAHDRVNSASGNLSTLNYENENGPRLIEEQQAAITRNNLKIVEGDKLAEKLKKEYKAISKWHWVKRGKAKRKYEDQLDVVRSLRNSVQSSKNRIEHLNHVMENFPELQANAERHLYFMQDQLATEQSILPTIHDLRERRDRASRDLEEVRRRARIFKDDLRRIQNRFEQCKRDLEQRREDNNHNDGDGQHREGDRREGDQRDDQQPTHRPRS